jgi:hypothetical protein
LHALLGGAALQRWGKRFVLIAALAAEGIFKPSPHLEKFSTPLRKSLWKTGSLFL